MSTLGDCEYSEEIVEEPEAPEIDEQNPTAVENQPNEDAQEQTSNVKRVRNPQPKLDAERLRGPRGLIILEDSFKDVKFKGSKYEEEDLNLLMKTYEYWCHRLFPKFPFDNCLQRLEKLGSSKLMQAYIKKIRMNEGVEDKPIVDSEDDDDDEANNDNTDYNNIPPTRDAFDMLLPSTQPLHRPTQSTNSDTDELTEEQLQRIRMNREKAQQRRTQIVKNLQLSQAESQNLSQSSGIFANENSQPVGSASRVLDTGYDFSDNVFSEELDFSSLTKFASSEATYRSNDITNGNNSGITLGAGVQSCSQDSNSVFSNLMDKKGGRKSAEVTLGNATGEAEIQVHTLSIEAPNAVVLNQCTLINDSSQSQDSEILFGGPVSNKANATVEIQIIASPESYIDTPDIIQHSPIHDIYSSQKSITPSIESDIDTPDIVGLSPCTSIADVPSSSRLESEVFIADPIPVISMNANATESIQSYIDTPDITAVSPHIQSSNLESEIFIADPIPVISTKVNATASIESYIDTPDIVGLSPHTVADIQSSDLESDVFITDPIPVNSTPSIDSYIDTPGIVPFSQCTNTEIQSSCFSPYSQNAIDANDVQMSGRESLITNCHKSTNSNTTGLTATWYRSRTSDLNSLISTSQSQKSGMSDSNDLLQLGDQVPIVERSESIDALKGSLGLNELMIMSQMDSPMDVDSD